MPPAASIPTATAAQMAQVDRIMMDELGIDVLQLMEAAGLAVTEAIRRQLGGDVGGKRVLLLAGTGGNGGDALVAARHLLARGARPIVVLAKPPEELPSVTAHQQRTAAACGATFAAQTALADDYDLIVDGLLGFSGRGDPRGEVAELIRAANDHRAPILAIDLPSGLDATTGERGDPCIEAATTIALVLPKRGFTSAAGQEACGAVSACDIGVPPWVLERVGIEAPLSLFASASCVAWQDAPRPRGKR